MRAGTAGRAATPSAVVLAGSVLVSLAIYGVLEGNLGTAYRRRLQFEWILVLPGAVS